MAKRKHCYCIVCNREMANINVAGMQPRGGLCFSTGGHYGSTVFDPMDGSRLEISLCDSCVTAGIKTKIVASRKVGVGSASLRIHPKS